uniref:Uncharacterized protein n=1 Tax=Vitis vinifera TaxID=29760 RepID=A5C5P7_VITVI|nr:hypothetical protein VITISV_012363 [Vitis vinifera]
MNHNNIKLPSYATFEGAFLAADFTPSLDSCVLWRSAKNRIGFGGQVTYQEGTEQKIAGGNGSGEGGMSADRIPDVRHPEKVGRRSDRIPDVRHPEKVECRRIEIRRRIPDARHPEKVGRWQTEFRMRDIRRRWDVGRTEFRMRDIRRRWDVGRTEFFPGWK